MTKVEDGLDVKRADISFILSMTRESNPQPPGFARGRFTCAFRTCVCKTKLGPFLSPARRDQINLETALSARRNAGSPAAISGNSCWLHAD